VSTFLGVDGGGTKTALCLVSDRGEVLTRLDGPGTYYLDPASAGDVGQVAAVLGEAVPQVCARAGVDPLEVDYAFFGLPAYGEVSGDRPALDAAPRAALGHDRYRCDNDMVCGWAGSLALADGINVVSGTGSISYGRHGERAARVGGWGELFGDEGSGYWVGVRALQAASQMSDGRRRAGPLLTLLRERLELATDLDLIDVALNRWRSDRGRVAGLSRLVVEAARLGDWSAEQILEEAAAELARLVEATREQLEFAADETVAVSYSGGMFAVPEVVTGFGRALEGAALPYALTLPKLPPVVGAALYAASLAGQPLGPAALQRLSEA
jgi:N-acetylglucosamine kinase-like BadF-type ATPase